MKTPQEIATTILGKEPTLPEEHAIWRGIVGGIEADRGQRGTHYATRDDWTVGHYEGEEGPTVDLIIWPPGAHGMTSEPVAVLALTDAGVDALIATLKPGA